MSDEHNDAIKDAVASLAIEGHFLTKEEEDLVRLKAENQINHKEFIKQAIELAEKGF